MLDKLKRKNDEKAKRRVLSLWQRVLLTTVVGILLIIGIVLVVLLRPAAPTTNFPTARLQYNSDQGTFALDLNTGERTHIVAPIPTTRPMSQFEQRAALQKQYSQSRSPDKAWIAYWDLVTEFYEWRLTYESSTSDYSRVLGTFFASPSRLAWSGDGEWIIYSAYPEGVTAETMRQSTAELWMIHFETGEIKRLSNNNFDEGDPAISPDGTQIVYTASADGYNRLYIMELATGEVRLLTPDLHGYRGTWSPDGRWIAFMTTSYDGNGDIWIIRADGTGAQAITTGTGREDNPSWVK